MRRPRRLLAPVLLALALLGTIAFFLLSPAVSPDGPPPGNPIVAPGATPVPTQLRGRSTTPVPVVVLPTAQPTQAPTALPTGPVGSPGGTGEGGDVRTPVERTVFSGRVVDARNGNGVARVCVVIGNVAECGPNQVYTDGEGRFSIELPSGAIWDMNFVHPDYRTAYRRVSSTRSQARVELGSISISPR